MHHKKHVTKRRYQRLATAIAGAAIMSTALLPGLPAAIAHAAPARHVVARPGASHQINETTPSTDTTNVAANDPVQVVLDNAGSYGLDASGRYSVISQSDTKTVVRVKSNGQTYKVDLVLRDGNWVIKAIRGIGDATHPATYTTGNFFNSTVVTDVVNQVPGTVVATLGTSQQVIYQNNNYDNWFWNGSAYPQDMAFGVLLQSPQAAGLATPLPTNLLNSINNINFSNRLVVYAHLGTAPAHGYGIGISRIEQNGNDLIVTVRTNNPQSGVALGSTQSDAYVAIDRSMLNMDAPIHVSFVDLNGTVLSSYTANAS
ncbi:MAG: hypothetical protein LLG02_07260 [Pelosinus sp.]|nr:hypothetical protein [Pelosinus sp.]